MSATGRAAVTEVAGSVPFDNSTNGFTADNVQDAIEEIKTNTDTHRYLLSCGFDGNASTGRYLEYNSNVDSNQSGYSPAMDSTLKELSLVVSSNSTSTWTLYLFNGTTETSTGVTISTSNSRWAKVPGLNLSVLTTRELRVKCTSGSCSRPVLYQYFTVD